MLDFLQNNMNIPGGESFGQGNGFDLTDEEKKKKESSNIFQGKNNFGDFTHNKADGANKIGGASSVEDAQKPGGIFSKFKNRNKVTNPNEINNIDKDLGESHVDEFNEAAGLSKRASRQARREVRRAEKNVEIPVEETSNVKKTVNDDGSYSEQKLEKDGTIVKDSYDENGNKLEHAETFGGADGRGVVSVDADGKKSEEYRLSGKGEDINEYQVTVKDGETKVLQNDGSEVKEIEKLPPELQDKYDKMKEKGDGVGFNSDKSETGTPENADRKVKGRDKTEKIATDVETKDKELKSENNNADKTEKTENKDESHKKEESKTLGGIKNEIKDLKAPYQEKMKAIDENDDLSKREKRKEKKNIQKEFNKKEGKKLLELKKEEEKQQLMVDAIKGKFDLKDKDGNELSDEKISEMKKQGLIDDKGKLNSEKADELGVDGEVKDSWLKWNTNSDEFKSLSKDEQKNLKREVMMDNFMEMMMGGGAMGAGMPGRSAGGGAQKSTFGSRFAQGFVGALNGQSPYGGGGSAFGMLGDAVKGNRKSNSNPHEYGLIGKLAEKRQTKKADLALSDADLAETNASKKLDVETSGGDLADG